VVQAVEEEQAFREEFLISGHRRMTRIPQTTHKHTPYDFKRMARLPRTIHEPTTFDFGLPTLSTRVDCMDLPNLAPQLRRPVHSLLTSAEAFAATPRVATRSLSDRLPAIQR
jgi:hypothetical protein